MYFDREDLIGAQQQVRPLKCLMHHGGIVLAGDADQRTGIGERTQQLLIQPVQLRMAGEVPGDRVRTNLADNAIPQRVVQVGDDALLRRRRQQRLRQLRGQPVGMLHGVRQAVVKIALEIETCVGRRVFCQPLHIDNRNAAFVRNVGGQPYQVGLKLN